MRRDLNLSGYTGRGEVYRSSWKCERGDGGIRRVCEECGHSATLEGILIWIW
jgi:hypothetical protein